jgi:kynureninase
MTGLLRADAAALDAQDPLANLRALFHIPRRTDGSQVVYLCGHSLGLAPKRAIQIINEELDAWARHGVDGHFTGERPWVSYHERATDGLAQLTGAHPIEVVAMNSLTVNLHLLLTSFYRPQGARRKILLESYAFSSDRYAIESQLRLHGLAPADALVLVAPRDGESLLRTEDICESIERTGDELACCPACNISRDNSWRWKRSRKQRIASAPMQASIWRMLSATRRSRCTSGMSISPYGAVTSI